MAVCFSTATAILVAVYFITVSLKLSDCSKIPTRGMRFDACSHTGVLNGATATLSPCTKKPCVLAKKSKVDVEFNFKMPVDSRTARLEMRAKYGIFNIPVFGIPTDFCTYPNVKCPLKKAVSYHTKYTVPIRMYYPEATGNFTIKGYADNNELLFCGVLPLTIIGARS